MKKELELSKKTSESLKIDSLISWLSVKFSGFTEKRGSNLSIKLKDGLLSGFAMFSLKDKSLLKFNNIRDEREKNLKTVYKIDQAPPNSGMRTILDEVKVSDFKGVFKGLINRLRRAGILGKFIAM